MQSAECFALSSSNTHPLIINVVNAKYALQITRWHLKLLGIWPLSSESSYLKKIFTNFIVITCTLLLMFIFIPGILFIFVKVKDPLVRLKLAGALSFCAMTIVKYYSLFSRRKDVTKCIEHLVSDWNRITSIDDRVIMVDCATYGRWVSIICAIFMYSGGIFYAGILPFVSPTIKDENNDTMKPLAYPSYYGLFETQGNITYFLVYFIHCCCAIVMHSTTSVSCNVAVVFAMHACGQLKILTNPLNNFINGTTKYQKLDEIFSLIIQHHTRTLRFINNLEKILNKICLVEMVGCTLVICLLEYYFLLEWRDSDVIGIMTYSILLASLTFNIFIFCYVGELLTDECRKVCDSTYMLNWYKLSAKNSRQIILVMMAAQNPVSISAGKLISLSHVNFLTVIRTSVVYFNLLRRVMG